MKSPTSRRFSWIVFPLLVVAWMAAPEWTARAGMLDSPWRDAWVPAATAWAQVHPTSDTRDATAQDDPVPSESLAQTAPAPTAPAATSTVTTPSIKPAAASSLSPAPSAVAVPTPKAVTEPPTQGTVLMLGDSLMGEVAAGLRQHLARTFVVVDRHKSSTGLTNLKYYDWPGTALAAATETHPQWVIVHMGANDAQDMALDGHFLRFGSAPWQAAYLARGQLMIDRIHEAAPKATVIWVGLPAMRSAAFDQKMDVIRSVQAQAAASRGVPYLDGHTALGKAYAKDGDLGDGHRRILRADDGIHYSLAGGSQLAHEAAEAPSLALPWNTP